MPVNFNFRIHPFENQFMEQPRLGNEDMTASFQRRIEECTEEKLNSFKAENERKRNAFIVSWFVFYVFLCPLRTNFAQFIQIFFSFRKKQIYAMKS